MKTKEEIKKYFENGDIPNQEQFWEWQDAYWHKNEKIPVDKIDLDLSQKADLVSGKVPASQLPSYVDDVLEFANLATFPTNGESGKIYVAADSNKLYRWSGSIYINVTPTEIKNLRNIVDMGNYVGPKRWISFLYAGTDPNTGEGDRAGAIGVNSGTYSFFFGNMNPNHTGIYNTSFGYNSLTNLTTGQYNTVSGHFSARDLTSGGANTIMGAESGIGLTTGNDNTLIGVSSGYSLKGGSGNAFLGKWTGCFITGANNTFLGYQAGQYWGKGGSGLWSSNIVIGGGTSGHPNGVWGENNMIIGSNIELIGNNSNRFIINNFANKANRWYDTHFIEGNFVDRWLKFDTSLQVLRLPEADLTFTRNLVSKPDGTFGWEDKTEVLPLSGTSTNSPLTGAIEYKGGDTTGINSFGFYSKSLNEKSGFDIQDDGALTPYMYLIDNNNRTSLYLSQEHVGIGSTNPNFSGLKANVYYGDHYEDESYVQKKYVDKKLSYSNTEVNTAGKWINGKPIYRKTVVYTTIPYHGEIDITRDFPNIEVIVSNQMFTEWYAMDVAFAGNQWNAEAFITIQPKMVKIQSIKVPNYDFSLLDSFTLTLEYTKTTD